MAPEYAFHGVFSTKSDVFSFGILMLETVSGMKNRGLSHMNQNVNLIGHVSNKESKYFLVFSCLYFI